MPLNENHVVSSGKYETMYDMYDCSYRLRAEIKLSDCVMQELGPGKQAALEHFAQQRLNDAVQDINKMAKDLLYNY